MCHEMESTEYQVNKGKRKKSKKRQAREILTGFQHTYGKIHTLPGRGVLYNFAGILVW